jgi:ABC-type transport system involved in cytochrome bd biosynthesis fused ATPase/permease subunit
VPLGDLRIVGPAVIAVCALILIARTRGVYTKWLAVNIIVSALALTYVIDPTVFAELLRQGAEEGLNAIR